MQTLNIFHIDDSDADALLFSRVLHESQHPTTLKWFPSAKEAIRFLEEAAAADFPDLIFCDLRMPGMSGHDFIRWLLQSQWRTVPVIVLSGSDMIEDIRVAYELGANSFLTKPILGPEILKLIQDAVDYRTASSSVTGSPAHIWFRRPDDGRRAWSAEDEFWNWFERVTEHVA